MPQLASTTMPFDVPSGLNAASGLVIGDGGGQSQAMVATAHFLGASLPAPSTLRSGVQDASKALEPNEESHEEDADVSMESLSQGAAEKQDLGDHEDNEDAVPDAGPIDVSDDEEELHYRRIFVLKKRKPGFKLTSEQPKAFIPGVSLKFFTNLLRRTPGGIARTHLASEITRLASSDKVDANTKKNILKFIHFFGKKYNSDEVVLRLSQWVHFESEYKKIGRAKEDLPYLYLPNPETPYYDKPQPVRRFRIRYKRDN
ncbi:hypothetical protein OC842_007497 [Tilletia horrida]|uniref:Uncharacterized protein n=1 Tax=Tilletia horrida TaxID=155126 RepID=A0AAN6G5C0_9BASI|nr:hypothetical protein OC842_007497 [Tilletia horrida]